MRWLVKLIDVVAVARETRGANAIVRPRRTDAASLVDSIGADGAPAMAFTDTMPGYLVAIDRPSAHRSN